MKVSLGMNLQTGPWGGGNQFGRALAEHLRQRGEEVSFDLSAPDLDAAILAEPRKRLTISAYDDADLLRYQLWRNRRAVVVHRVNECDERKDTAGVNARLRRANLCADHTVFVSAWLRDLHLAQGWPGASHGVIRNGSDTAVFNPEGFRPWDGRGPLRIVTHHWSDNWRKGFDIYTRLDRLLGSEPFRGAFRFTYIGNLPRGLELEHTEKVAPLAGRELAERIKQSHLYLTASLNEPGSNHQNEAALCGLPLLYLQSGSLPEYCEGFGISFTPEDFEDKLWSMRREYQHWADRMPRYPYTAERTCRAYHELLQGLADRRDELVARRSPARLWRWARARLGGSV